MTAGQVVRGAQRLRTAAWHGDRPLDLRFPDDWQVTTWWPRTPPPLTDEEIRDALERPVGQPPVRELARGRSRPVLVVDDPTRPTPAARVLPHLLRQLDEAGIARRDVGLVVATGTHAPPSPEALARKLGPEASSCRVHVHDARRGVERVGRTSFGTPVLANREVLRADLVVGVGGIYPQHSTGFGGGSKLALGVLGLRSIAALHYGHDSMHGSYRIENDFRRDLDEIAPMIGLRTSVSLHVDAERRVVRVACGDPLRYHRDEVAFCLQAYAAPLPGDADVVVANAYPIDVSLTFMRSKGIIPLLHAAPGASRVLVAACSEGIGHHGLFPFVNGSRLQRPRHVWRTVRADPMAVPAKGARRVLRAARAGYARLRPAAPAAAAPARHPIWLVTPGREPGTLPEHIPGMSPLPGWDHAIARVLAEQGGRRGLRVVVYPCAPLQVLT